MFAILHVPWIFVVDIFKSRRKLEAENLRETGGHQLSRSCARAREKSLENLASSSAQLWQLAYVRRDPPCLELCAEVGDGVKG
jgi:hypothetical protein